MMGAPSEVLEKQLKELHIQIDPKVVAQLKADVKAEADKG
jgi:hypothetical protein